MMHRMSFQKRSSLLATLLVGVMLLLLLIPAVRFHVASNVASVFFAESYPVEMLQAKYDTVAPASKAIRILLVAGHEPNFGGAMYGDHAERDMTVQLAQFLASYLEQDSRFQVVQTRDTEDWNPILAHYFSTHASATDAFYADKKDEMAQLIDMGLVQTVSSTPHNSAPADVARRLYGINEWANEQKIDLVVNIHFNDVKRRDVEKPGLYSGFAVYVPERQYSNSSSARAVAEVVIKRLRTIMAVSDLKAESAGVVEDQELISLGRYNTLDAPGVLIEYGYIYERQFDEPNIRRAVLKEMAFETAVGIQDFFAGRVVERIPPVSTLLPFSWGDTPIPEKEPTVAVLSLQAALRTEGAYPPATSTLRECPLSGDFGTCTTRALAAFQKKHSITGEVGIVGTTTRAVLNRKYSR